MGSCREVLEFRCAEVAKQSAAAAAAARAADTSGVEAAVPASASITIAAAATATTHVVSATGTRPASQELTASNGDYGDVDAQHQRMQQTRRHCDRRCSVDRISCDIGCDRRSSHSKGLRVAVLCISRHSSYGQLGALRLKNNRLQQQQQQQQQ